jgi:hypothetical protein
VVQPQFALVVEDDIVRVAFALQEHRAQFVGVVADDYSDRRNPSAM